MLKAKKFSTTNVDALMKIENKNLDKQFNLVWVLQKVSNELWKMSHKHPKPHPLSVMAIPLCLNGIF